MLPILPNDSEQDKKIPLREAGKKYGETALDAVKSEVNLLVLPFFALWDKDVGKRTEIDYRTTVVKGVQKVKIAWTVSASSKYGFPGPFDKEVHKAIEQIICELPLPIQNPIPLGSLYNLCKRMGLNNFGGSQYRKVKKALERITTASIKSEGTFYSKEKKEWIEDIFHLYDRVIFRGKKLPNGEIADTNYLFLNSWYLDNINAHYVKPIDWNYYKLLKTPVAQRLYELLSVKFYGLLMKRGKYISYKYSTICSLLPTVRQRYLSKAKETLEPAHKKLKETGFLESWDWRELSQKGEEKDWLIRYYPGVRAKEETKRFRVGEQIEFALPLPKEEGMIKVGSELSVQESSIVEQLTHRGITTGTAKRLVNIYPTEQICRQIEVFDWLKKKKSPLIGKNSAGFLRKSIEEDYQPPEEYSLYLEKEARKLEEERARDQRQAKEEEKEKGLARIRTYKEGLSQEERAKLREEAEAEIRSSGKYKQDFITEHLIQAKENEIIVRRLGIDLPE